MRTIAVTILALVWGMLISNCSTKARSADNISLPPADTVSARADNPAMTKRAVDLRVEMRKLWEDQATWTRNEILCLVDDLPGSDHAIQRLLKNQEDIGHALRSYYSPESAARITELLKDNVTLSADVFKAVEDKDNKLLNTSNRKWFANADSVAVILSLQNPNYGMGELKLLLHEHLKLMTDVARARAKRDYDADIKAYDIAHDQVLKLSDVLTEGIIHQFPDKFD